MLRNWRPWLLIVLLVGPILAYIGFGFLWLRERGWWWVYTASAIWIATGVVWGVLMERWTRSKRTLLPPIDWDAPGTFSEFDHKAWLLVQEEARQSESLSMEQLSQFDTYIEVGRRLARRLAAHYHPLTTDPIEHVPVIELLTALELATEDLDGLCRQVPGGDLVTPAHWKRAVQVSGYISKANDIYSYLLPLFQPMTGIPRLAAQRLMVKPAWKNMQQNLMRWFFAAFVNRLGTHLVELYSGRLSIGADQYRKLNRRHGPPPSDDAMGPVVVAVAGARDSGRSRLIAAIEAARAGDLGPLRGRLLAAGLDETLADRFKAIKLVEVPGYVARPGDETARERATRREAVEAAADADLLVLVIDAGREDITDDVEFARAWGRWFQDRRGRELPPALVALVGVDRPDLGNGWSPPYQWGNGRSPREIAVRARMEAHRAAMPPEFSRVVPIGLPDQGTPFGVVEELLPAIASLIHRAERAHLLRHIEHQRGRSKAARFLGQVGRQGRKLWERRKKTGSTGG